MGIGSIGIPSMIMIITAALIIFGPKRLPEIGKATGQTLKEFKTAAKDVMTDDPDDEIDMEENKNNQKVE